jgi:hypothetical protein
MESRTQKIVGEVLCWSCTERRAGECLWEARRDSTWAGGVCYSIGGEVGLRATKQTLAGSASEAALGIKLAMAGELLAVCR